jgi:hypothetical protein
VLLRVLGRAPWRCGACGRRFTAPSDPEIESRRRHHTLAGYLGVRDPKQRHSVNQRALGAVAALAALVLALGLLRYCASETRSPESQGGPASAMPAGPQPSG